MRKRILSLFLSGLLGLSLIGCQGEATQITEESGTDSSAMVETDNKVDLMIWAEEDSFEMLSSMVESFKKKYAGEVELEVTFSAQSDANVRDVILGDVHNAPDIFHFPDDQLNSLIAGGVLSEVPNAANVKSANIAEAVSAASLGDKLYAYPMTADNGYFLYYDKSYLSAEDVKTLDGILAVAAANEKKFTMEFDSGWYLYTFFGGAGLEMGLNEDGVTNYCNWNTTEGNIKGTDVANALTELVNHPGFRAALDSEFIPAAKEGIVIAAISGAWNAMSVKEVWGADYGAVKLPTYTCAGKQVQMSSFTSYKMIGVNSYSEHLDWAHKLADWLTNEDNQTLRFVEKNQGPSNINAAASDEVIKVPAIKAVIEQSKYGQLQRVGNNYWSPCTDFANIFLQGNPSGKPMQELLDDLVEGITASTVK